MSKLLLPGLLILALIFMGCPADEPEDQPADAPDTETAEVPEETPVPDEEAAQMASASPLDRGMEIYFGTDYSNTGLACAHCHAAMPQDEQNRIFIAHSGYGAIRRGAWKIGRPEQLEAGKGFADTVIDAANVCVKAPYMDHGEQLIEGEDADALMTFLESVAVDEDPFIIARASGLPEPGLTPDKTNGERIYNQSCQHCHAAGIEDLPGLEGARDWLNPLQVMAKVRKLKGDWYNDYKGLDYASYDGGTNPGGDNPCNPCNPCGDSHEGHDHDGMFAQNSMPFYGTDILSDQDVVDVSYFVSQDM